MNTEKRVKTVYRIPPYPTYDVEGMQNWLSAQAAEGLVLKQDGFLFGVAAFEQTTPHAMQYRLEPVPPRGILDDPNEIPCTDVQETYAELGWTYVATRRPFYIFSADAQETRELHTDPQVHALAIRALIKCMSYPAIVLFFWLLVFPLLFRKSGLLLSMFALGTPLCLIGLVLLGIYVVGSIIEAVHLRRIYHRLRARQPLTRRTAAASDRRWYTIGKATLTLITAVWVFIFCGHTLLSVTDENEKPLSEFNGNPPFATIANLAPQGEYRQTNLSFSNKFELRHDILAPRMIEWSENADVKLADGTTVSGGLIVDYFETISPTVARIAAWEMQRIDSREKNYTPIDLPPLDVDHAAAYEGSLHSPVVILQKGSVFIRIVFYQTSADHTLPLEAWVTAAAEQLRTSSAQ